MRRLLSVVLAAMVVLPVVSVVAPPAASAARQIVVPTDRPTIQSAVDSARPGDTIRVLPGVFTEQVTIDKNLTVIGGGARATTIEAPKVLRPRVIGPVPGRANIVEVFGGARVTLRTLGISGPAGTTCPGLAGVSVQDGATLELTAAAVRGCTEEGMFVGFASFLPIGPEVGHAVVTGTELTGSRLAGIRAGAPGTTLAVSGSRVVLANAPEVDGPSGISLVDGVRGAITGSTISGALCGHPDCGPDFFTQLQGAGIVALGVASGTLISQNIISGNDIGLGVAFTSGCCQIRQNIVQENRYFGIIVADGDQTISASIVQGGLVGVAAIAIETDTTATLNQVAITGSTQAIAELTCCGSTARVIPRSVVIR